MAGYLDQYGAGDLRREKITKIVIYGLIAVVVIGGYPNAAAARDAHLIRRP
jgi:hypothetical protein